uniref:Ras association domain-containing protein 2-like n=1 Tax=Phallusia mammillata TaxID=59560 RepID=A0A6F9DQJ2_9ASCI|nr:ras association domain-containing protein 2-like [Phallusia mammillata]
MATLKAAYNRFLSAFSRFWAQNREDEFEEETASDTKSREIPKIKVDEVDDVTLVSSSETESVTLRVGNGRRKETKALFRRSYYALRSSTESLLKKSPKKMAEIKLSDSKTLATDSFMSRLNDYNTYYDGGAEKLGKRQNKKGELVVEGLLNIYWGLKTAIRLQLADDDEKIRPMIQGDEEQTENGEGTGNKLEVPGASGANLNVENAIWGKTRQRRNDRRRGAMRLRVRDPTRPETDSDEEGGSLARTSSVIMRKKGSRNLRHRASINGHSYNYRTSVFTPAFGSVTKVRVTSQNNAHTVVTKLFAKFRVENTPDDFSLYIVKETGERRELPGDEFPLLSRVLVGPNEKLGKIFLQERKMHKEISPEVAQYIKLDTRILQVFLTKFAEEEDKEVSKMRKRFEFYRKMLRKEIREQKQAQSG